MRLYLVRHGDSLSSEVDPERSLSEKGKRETEKVASLLATQKLKIDMVYHSNKARAKQTAEIMATQLSIPRREEKEGIQSQDPAAPLAEEIKNWDQDAMIVSHMPFIENLCSYLLFGEERQLRIAFCGSCVVCLTEERREWFISWIISPNM